MWEKLIREVRGRSGWEARGTRGVGRPLAAEGGGYTLRGEAAGVGGAASRGSTWTQDYGGTDLIEAQLMLLKERLAAGGGAGCPGRERDRAGSPLLAAMEEVRRLSAHLPSLPLDPPLEAAA